MLAKLLAKRLARLAVVIIGTSKNAGHVIIEKNCRWTIEINVKVSGEHVKLTAQK